MQDGAACVIAGVNDEAQRRVFGAPKSAVKAGSAPGLLAEHQRGVLPYHPQRPCSPTEKGHNHVAGALRRGEKNREH